MERRQYPYSRATAVHFQQVAEMFEKRYPHPGGKESISDRHVRLSAISWPPEEESPYVKRASGESSGRLPNSNSCCSAGDSWFPKIIV